MDNNSFSLESMFSKLNSNIIIQSIIRICIIVVICLVKRIVQRNGVFRIMKNLAMRCGEGIKVLVIL